MSISRPFIPVIVQPASQPGLEQVLNKTGYIVGLDIDVINNDVSRKNVKKLIKGNTPFLVIVNRGACRGNRQCMMETSEIVELCLFSKNYFRIDNIPVIVFRETQTAFHQDEDRLSREWLIPHLQNQGWPLITEWELQTSLSFQEQVRGRITPPLLIRDIDFNEAFLREKFFSDPHYLGNYIFFQDSPTASAEQLEAAFTSLCVAAIGNNPLWEVSFSEYLSARDSLSELRRKNNMLQEMLNNAETTIKQISGTYKRDYNLLFKWYHKEYEVLPLWYKRFGHIIKVFMGQRTFRSLFDNQPKKIAE